jgi:hypothetical protein
MNDNSKEKLNQQLESIINLIRRYSVTICVVMFGLLYAFLLVQIGKLDKQEPSEAAVTAQLESIKRPKVDKQVADKMKNLEEQNIEIKSLFEQARNNPFEE